MEKLRRIVVITSPFEHSNGPRTTIPPRHDGPEAGRIRGKLKNEILRVVRDQHAHLVLNNVRDGELLGYARMAAGRVSDGYDATLEKRVEAIAGDSLKKLRITSMGEYASACASVSLVEVLSGVHAQTGRMPPLENLRVDLDGSFLDEDFARGNIEGLSKPELEWALQRELDSFKDTIREMVDNGGTHLGWDQLKPLLDDPHIVLPKHQFDAIRQRHWDARLTGLAKLAEEAGWSEADLGKPRARRTLGGILLGAFGAETAAHAAVEQMDPQFDAMLRKRYRSAGREYMLAQLKARRPGK